MTLYALGARRPVLPEGGDFWIAPDANVIGDVRLSPGCSIWFGATLRGDNEPIRIGSDTNIQDHTVIHTDPGFPCTLGQGVTVGHKAMLHGCIIGDGVLIGMGATVLNGAVIGANSVIGAGALVTEGKEIPEGSLVMGMPGKIRGEVEARHIEMNRRSATTYVDRMRQYRAGFRPLEAQ